MEKSYGVFCFPLFFVFILFYLQLIFLLVYGFVKVLCFYVVRHYEDRFVQCVTYLLDFNNKWLKTAIKVEFLLLLLLKFISFLGVVAHGLVKKVFVYLLLLLPNAIRFNKLLLAKRDCPLKPSLFWF